MIDFGIGLLSYQERGNHTKHRDTGFNSHANQRAKREESKSSNIERGRDTGIKCSMYMYMYPTLLSTIIVMYIHVHNNYYFI